MTETYEEWAKRRERDEREDIRAHIGGFIGMMLIVGALAVPAGLVRSYEIRNKIQEKENAVMQKKLLKDFYVPNPNYFSYDEPQLYLGQKSSSR